jgi:hypothetical protein
MSRYSCSWMISCNPKATLDLSNLLVGLASSILRSALLVAWRKLCSEALGAKDESSGSLCGVGRDHRYFRGVARQVPLVPLRGAPRSAQRLLELGSLDATLANTKPLNSYPNGQLRSCVVVVENSECEMWKWACRLAASGRSPTRTPSLTASSRGTRCAETTGGLKQQWRGSDPAPAKRIYIS